MKYLIITFSALLLSCSLSKLPKEKLSAYELDLRYEFTDDSLRITLGNTLHCPMRIWVQPKDSGLRSYFDDINPVTVDALSDTILQIEIREVELKELNFASRFGSLEQEVTAKKVELPFPKGKEYPLIQGYNSYPTHNTDWSRYALDFGLKIGDTVCAATPGFVVGLTEDYRYGGEDKKWQDFGNFITIYDPGTGLFTQYVHLDYKGSLVAVGDTIFAGQKIGLAGVTGYTNIEHLHFNTYKPIHSQAGLISIPMDSIGPYRISGLERNQMIKH